MRIWLIMLLSALLGGCFNLGNDSKGGSSVIYVLADKPAAAPRSAPALPYTLLIEPTHTSAYDNNIALVYSRTPDTRGHYKYARWSERPSVRLSELLFNRLSVANLYATVADSNSDVVANRRLATELVSFYHDASTDPGHVHVALRAELFDTLHRRLIARRLFEEDVPVKNYNAAGAATAFNLATQALLDDIVAWLGSADTQPSAAHSQ